MALILWLPLIENTNNQAASDYTIETIGTITYVDGKLGKCVKLGDGTQVANGINITNTNFVDKLVNKGSCSVWIKPSGRHVHYEGAIISSGNWNQKMWAFGVNQDNTAVDVFGPSYNRNVTCSIPVNEWTHLVCTYDNGIAKLYKNGVYVNSYSNFTTTVFESDATNTTIGRETYAGGYFSFNGCIQDIRIYDDVLSEKEIEVLSRGLVLHYPLDREGFGQDNLLKSTPKGTDPSAYNFIQLNLTSNLQANTTYTMQLWDVNISHSGKNDSQLGISVYWGGGSVSLFSWTGTTYFTNGHADYLVKAFTITETQANHSNAVNAWLNIYNSVPNATGTRNGTIGKWKLEIGDKATPWTPAPTDDLYADMGLDTGIVYDVSGYKRNGTASGVTYSGDTAKYLASTSFDGIDDGVTITNLNIANILNDKCTISFWIKPNGDNGGRSVYFSAYNQKSWSIEKSAQNKLRSYWNGTPDKTISEITISDGTWQHIAIAKNGTSSIKFYYNGEFKKELTDAHNALTFGTTWRLGRDTRSNDGTPYKGLMSDFRIYATALSADAIAELYHTGASLANNGTLMSNQYVEV